MSQIIEGHDFVFTGLQPWDLGIGSNARDIATEVSANNRVLYVNTPLAMYHSDLKSTNVDVQYRQKVLRGEASPLRKINDRLWLLDFPFTMLPANSLPDGRLFDMVNRANNRKIFRFINKAISELGFRDVIHFNDNDIYRSFYAKQYLNACISAYYRRDNLLAIDFWKRHARRLEPMLIAKSDLVVCNSAELAEVARVSNPATYDIGQGVDLSSYKITSDNIPSDMADIPHPIVGYIGHLTSLRLDPELIYNMAAQNPKISFVMTGTCDEVFQNHPMRGLSNVFFLGNKPRESVPSYINAYDICINPQAINDLTIGNYPRKIDEYLALGKPTIATKTRTMMMFQDYVYLCDTLADYQRALDKIIAQNDWQPKYNLVEFAHTHTWEASVEALYKAIKTKL